MRDMRKMAKRYCGYAFAAVHETVEALDLEKV